ncbi:MAG TPA: hypothetical protein VFP84_24935 [Kofleriaceae bacterium]|nr:hypothetical protein [Kofleriaceae bacterium]
MTFIRHAFRSSSFVIALGLGLASLGSGCATDDDAQTSAVDQDLVASFPCSCNGVPVPGGATSVCGCAAACGVSCFVADSPDSLTSDGCVIEASGSQTAFACTANAE